MMHELVSEDTRVPVRQLPVETRALRTYRARIPVDQKNFEGATMTTSPINAISGAPLTKNRRPT